MSLKRALDTLEATQEVPQHNCLHSRGILRVPPQLKKSLGFPSSSRDEGPFPCFVGKGIPAFSSHLKMRQSKLDTKKQLQGSCHHYKRPQYPNPLQIHQLPCIDSMITPRIDSKHDGMCDRPVVPREKATDPFVNSTGSMTLLFLLERRLHLHV